jgi:hypothetical protein
VETFADYAYTTVSSGGTTAPAAGTSQTWTVASSALFPAAATGSSQFHVADPALPGEVIAVTNVSGTTWTVTRGAGTGGVVSAHSAGFTVKQVAGAGFFQLLPQWANVVAYGADPTGTNDSTTAIGSAVAAASAAGAPVYIPAGTYKISAALNWKLAGLVVRTDGAANVKIIQETANTPGLQVAGQGQHIDGLTITCASQQSSSQTSSIGVEYGDNSVGSCFLSTFEDLRVELFATGMAINPAVSTVAGLFSCWFGNVEVMGFSIAAIYFYGSNGGGANCTGCVFDNVYIHNNYSGSDANSTSWPLELNGWDEAVFSQLNVEHAEVFDSDACLFTHCGNIIVNSMHLEHLELSGTPGNGLIAVGTGTGMVQVNGLSVRYMTFTGGSYNSVFRVTGGSGQSIVLNGLNFPSADGGDTVGTIALVDFNSATGVSAQLTGLNSTATQLWTETYANAGSGCSGQITDGSQVTYFPALAWTTFATGSAPNGLNMTSGGQITPTAGEWYYADLYVPYTVPLTGIIADVPAGTGGTDKWIVAILPYNGGAVLANSATAGVTTPVLNNNFKLPFTSQVTLPGPAVYKAAFQSNGANAKFTAFANDYEGFTTGSQSGTFGTIPTFSAPAGTYTANIGPMLKTY